MQLFRRLHVHVSQHAYFCCEIRTIFESARQPQDRTIPHDTCNTNDGPEYQMLILPCEGRTAAAR